jgi:GNAT superfamily N-acetyltransferase
MTQNSAGDGGASLRLRDARPEDKAAIEVVTRAAYAQYGSTMPPRFWPMYWQNLVAALEGESSAEVIVADLGGSIVGVVRLYPPSTNAYSSANVPLAWPEIRLLAVAPEARGRGVGQALMDECLRRARKVGAVAVGLHTMPVMEEAVRMYERMGFVPAPETDFRPMPGIVVQGYRRDL